MRYWSTGCLALSLAGSVSLFAVPASAEGEDISTSENNEQICVLTMTRTETERATDLYGELNSGYCGLDVLSLEGVRVAGDRYITNPGAFSALSGAEVEAIAPGHAAELLNTLPGVNIHMNSGMESLTAIRSPVLTGGAGQGSFLVLQNGVPTRSPAFGNVNMFFEPHYEVANAVEVVRGPASAKYGSNAVHGLVNFILPDSGTEQREFRLSGSTLGRYKGDLIAQSETGFAAISAMHDNGWRDDTSVDQVKASASREFEFGEWVGTAWASFTQLNQETAGFIQGPKAYEDEDIASSNPNPEAFRDARFAMAAVRLEQDFGDFRANITPYARWQEMSFRQHFLPYKGLEENDHHALGAMGNLEGYLGDGIWRFGGMVDFASGDLKETQADPFGFFPGDTRFPVGSHYNYTVDTLAAALWGQYEFQIAEDVSVLAGLRAETHDYDYKTHIPAGISGRFNVPDDRSDQFDLVTPKLGIIWTDALGKVDLYANYARGQRAPQASDLYRLQSQQVVGEVKSETLDSLEIGARGGVFDDRLVFDIEAYTMEKKNFFFRDASGLNVPNGKTDHMGVELAFGFELTESVYMNGTLSWADHTYDFDRASNGIVSGNQVDTAPEWLGDVSLDWKASDKLDVSLMAEFVGEYFTDEANAHTYDGHTLASARAGYAITDDVEFWVKLRNLFDERYADRADFAFGNERYFPGEPLNATFGIKAKW